MDDSPQALSEAKTPWEIVTSRFEFPKEVAPGIPFIPHPLQIEAINQLASLNNQGHWMDVGTGKTFMATAVALYLHMMYGTFAVCVMPPHLTLQWYRWLRKVTDKLTGEPLKVILYGGPPKKREQIELSGAQFFLSSIRMFVKDLDRFKHLPRGKAFYVIDEAHLILTNVETKQFAAMVEMLPIERVAALTGTPNATPLKAYGLIRFTVPGKYRSYAHFKREHVDELDFWNKPATFKNLDGIRDALATNSHRLLYSDMYDDLDVPKFVPMEYSLSKDHRKLYRKIASEKVRETGDGGKEDSTQVSKLFHNMGQLVLNYGHFAEDPKKKSEAISVLRNYMDSIGDEKVVFFAHYQLTVALMCSEFADLGFVPYNGAVSDKDKDANKTRFMTDPKCRGIVIQYRSGSSGLDGLQYASYRMIMVEPGDPNAPDVFVQCVGRLMRRGQQRQVMVGLLQARATLQPERYLGLVAADKLAAKMLRPGFSLEKELGLDGDEDDGWIDYGD